jgi:DNA polymerase
VSLPALSLSNIGAPVPILHRDFETRSALDLEEVGAWRYAADPTTDVWCVAYAVDNEPVKLWLPGQPIPKEFQIAARDPDWLVAAHNDSFETAIEQRILAPRYGWPLVPIERHVCTMATGLANALPGRLKLIAEVLELSARKDAEGGKLMLQMARPRKPRAGEDPNGIYWHDEPEKVERLYAYCRQDVEVERELHHRLTPLAASEQALWVFDQQINQRGFHVDLPLLEAASRIAIEANRKVQDELVSITGGALTSTNQTKAMQDWLGEHGCEVSGVGKAVLNHALRRKGLDPVVRRVMELRISAAHAAAAKVDTLLSWRDADGRVRGSLRFCGAGTGRWTGIGVQPQNFKRDSDNMEAKRIAVLTGDLAHVSSLYPPLEAVGDIARAMITAPPGHRFLIGDFSGVESRVTAWISGQRSKVDQWAKFDRTGDPKDEPYYINGRNCGLPEDVARGIGKIADLAFGYQGSVGAWRKLAPDDDNSTDAEIARYRDAWRRAHQFTTGFWSGVNRKMVDAVSNPGTVIKYKRLTITCDGSFLRVTLPSGRALSYPFPRLDMDKYKHEAVTFKDNAGGKWVDCCYGRGCAYGGLWTENIVQAISRDLLAAAMQRVEAAGYKIALHVHDEIVAEAPEGFGSVEEFTKLITGLPEWAEGLPVAAKVRNGPRFSKAEKLSAPPQPITSSAPQNGAAVDDEHDVMQQNSSTISTAPPWEGESVMKKKPPADDSLDSKIDQMRALFCTNAPSVVPDVPRAEVKANGHDTRQPGDYTSPTRDTGKQVAFFTYNHADGRPYLGVKKTSTKQFPQYHWNGGGWAKGAPTGPKIPYRLPELIKAALDEVVIIAAGEKDADTAAGLGFVSTTNSEGERKGAWTPALNAWFVGRKRVAIMEDNDATGRAHFMEVANSLRGVVSDIRIVTFRDLPEHNDLTDWIERGHSRDDLLAKIGAAKPVSGDIKILPKAEFLSGFIPPDYLVDGILQRRFIYALTGQTGHAKTAIALRLVQLVDDGGLLDGHEVSRGRAAYLVGENPDDVRMRVIADDATLGHSGTGNTIFVPGTFDTDGLLQKIESLGELDFLIVDTSAAYFLGDDENSNTELGEHARKLRRLISLPGGPCCLVLCHPIKHAAEPAQLLPRGGGSFLAEIDGNLTAWKDDKIITLHHSDKFRGPGFEPITFRLDTVVVEELKDSRGRMIPTVRAVPISDDEKAQEAQTTRRDEDMVLIARSEGGRSMSLADIADALDWRLADGRPYKSRVQRALSRLKIAGLMKPHRGEWIFTEKGEKAVEELTEGE